MIMNTGDLLLQEEHRPVEDSTSAFLQSFIRWIDPGYEDSVVVLTTDKLQRDIRADGMRRMESPKHEMKDQSTLTTPKMRRLATLERAVLHDQGVVFDATALGYTVISTEGHLSQTFRISIFEQTIWVILDRDSHLPHNSAEDNARAPLLKTNYILLPTMKNKLDAEGTIGRGLHLTQLGNTLSLPIPASLTPYSSERIWQTTSSRFSSAFTCGLITKVTPAGRTHAPLLHGTLMPTAKSSPASAFLISTDVASWPDLQNVRTECSLYRNLATPWVVPIALLICAGLLTSHIFQLNAGTAPGGSWKDPLAVLRILACLVWPLLIALNSFSGRAWERRIRYRRWVRTFHPTTPEMRVRYASWGFRCRTQVADVLYVVFLLDPIIQICVYIASHLRRREGRDECFPGKRARSPGTHLETGRD